LISQLNSCHVKFPDKVSGNSALNAGLFRRTGTVRLVIGSRTRNSQKVQYDAKRK
jgi:hypothetical protein